MTTWIDEEIERDAAFGNALAEETLVVDATEAIAGAMRLSGVSKSVLSDRLGTSRAAVTQLLGGGRNLTLRTLARVAYALGFRVKVSLRPLATEHIQYRRSLSVYEPLLTEGVVAAPVGLRRAIGATRERDGGYVEAVA